MQNCKVSGVKYAVTVERTYSTLRSPNNPANFASSSHITLYEIKRTFPILSEFRVWTSTEVHIRNVLRWRSSQNKHLYITRNTQQAAQVLMTSGRLWLEGALRARMYNSLSSPYGARFISEPRSRFAHETDLNPPLRIKQYIKTYCLHLLS
jgi:hypothetical protein